MPLLDSMILSFIFDDQLNKNNLISVEVEIIINKNTIQKEIQPQGIKYREFSFFQFRIMEKISIPIISKIKS